MCSFFIYLGFSQPYLQVTHANDPVLLTVSQLDKNIQEISLNSEAAWKIRLMLMNTKCFVSDLFLRMRLMKRLQRVFIRGTQSLRSNPLKVSANTDTPRCPNCTNITEHLAEPLQRGYTGPPVRVQCGSCGLHGRLASVLAS